MWIETDTAAVDGSCFIERQLLESESQVAWHEARVSMLLGGVDVTDRSPWWSVTVSSLASAECGEFCLVGSSQSSILDMLVALWAGVGTAGPPAYLNCWFT